MKKILGRALRGIVGIAETMTEHIPLLSISEAKQLGTSFGRRDIVGFTVGNGPTHVLVVAAIHGNEVGTTKLAAHLLDWLAKHPDAYPNLKVTVIPCLNPDGHALARKHPNFFNDGRIGRQNGRTVDLNRNFPTASFQTTSDWTHGKNYQERTTVFCGEHGSSEPETASLIDYIKTNGITAYIALHSAGRDVMGNDTELGQALAETFSAATGYRLTGLDHWKELRQTGTAKEWCDEQRIAYLEIEASRRWGSDWKNQRPGLLACFDLLNRQAITT